MTDREAFEKWWSVTRFGYDNMPEEVDAAWKSWQACAEHHEQVMRRAVDHAFYYNPSQIENSEKEIIINAIIARAKGE